MEDMQLALTAARVDQKNFGLWLKNWQVGQTLNALVTAQRPTGDLVLRVAGQQITARADIPLQQGTHLLLEVRQLQPQVVLKIVSRSAQAPRAGGNAAAGPSGTGLLQLLSPGGAQPATRTLADIVATLRTLQTALPPASGNSVQRLLASFPALSDLLGASGLRRAMQSSGTFLEATLAQTPAQAGADDIKAQLMRVLAQVNAALQGASANSAAPRKASLLGEGRRDLEVVLGSITLNQLQSQAGDNASLRAWVFDVPFVLGNRVSNLHVRIDRDDAGASAGDDDSAPRWRVELELDLPGLGPLLLTTQLLGERVAVDLAAREDRTRELLWMRVGELAAALDGQGLPTPSLQVSSWRSEPSDSSAISPGTASPQKSWRA